VFISWHYTSSHRLASVYYALVVGTFGRKADVCIPDVVGVVVGASVADGVVITDKHTHKETNTHNTQDRTHRTDNGLVT